jgi:hypothetical protein
LRVLAFQYSHTALYGPCLISRNMRALVMPASHGLTHIRASVIASTVDEGDAVCHQNIADDVADLVTAVVTCWRRSPRAFLAVDPDPDLVFASIADVLADLLSGLSSGHLRALYAARPAAR